MHPTQHRGQALLPGHAAISDPQQRLEAGGQVEVLRQVVAVVPVAESVSTTQAGLLLGLSRPTVVKLLERGAMTYQQAGSHRRIDLGEVLAYRQARRQA